MCKKFEAKAVKQKKENYQNFNSCSLGRWTVRWKKFTISQKYKFKIIEDASHALGSRYRSSKVDLVNILN